MDIIRKLLLFKRRHLFFILFCFFGVCVFVFVFPKMLQDMCLLQLPYKIQLRKLQASYFLNQLEVLKMNRFVTA